MGGSSTPSSTDSETTSVPWGPTQKYIVGKKQGVMPNAWELYKATNQLTPEQESLNSQYLSALGQRSNAPWTDAANAILGGAYNVNGSLDLNAARASQGALDPTASMQRLLSGRIDNPYLQGMHQSYINDSLLGYSDAIDQLKNNVLPGISQQAFGDGGFGGSRQGIAEGLALQQAQKNARDLGIQAMDSGMQLYGGAYSDAQNKMAAAAGDLNQQAAQAGQFNQGLNMAQAQQNAGMLDAGINMLSSGWSVNDNLYNQMLAILQQPQLQWQNALNQYASIVTPGAGLGTTTSGTSSIPIYTNTGAQIIGGMAGLGGLLGSLGGS